MLFRSTYAQIVGDLPKQLMEEYGDATRVKIKPADLYVEYDVLVRDGSIPGGNFSDEWLQLFQTVATDHDLRQMFDIPRIFTHIARNMGAKDVDSFKKAVSQIKPQSMPDDKIQGELDKGNIIPTPTGGPV